MLRRFLLILVVAVWSWPVLAKPTEVVVEQFAKGFPYRAFDTRDVFGRSVRFYLTGAEASDDRPLILAIQGSGCNSMFSLQDGAVMQDWHALVRQVAGNRAQVLVVEKPGVALFDQQGYGAAVLCSADFKREQTGERWLAALAAAVRGVEALRGKAPRAVLALGHSEGAVMAPRLALAVPAISHVASLAASPMAQLHDFFDMAASGTGFIAKRPGTPGENMKRVLEAWAQVSADPVSDTRQVFGHPYRYWADKFTPFDWSRLEATRARFFLAHGDADENSSVRTFDAFALELILRKRDVTWLRVAGADHGFAQKGDASGAGMVTMLKSATAWFLGDNFERQHVIWPL